MKKINNNIYVSAIMALNMLITAMPMVCADDEEAAITQELKGMQQILKDFNPTKFYTTTELKTTTKLKEEAETMLSVTSQFKKLLEASRVLLEKNAIKEISKTYNTAITEITNILNSLLSNKYLSENDANIINSLIKDIRATSTKVVTIIEKIDPSNITTKNILDLENAGRIFMDSGNLINKKTETSKIAPNFDQATSGYHNCMVTMKALQEAKNNLNSMAQYYVAAFKKAQKTGGQTPKKQSTWSKIKQKVKSALEIE